jgi:hypothetical protein
MMWVLGERAISLTFSRSEPYTLQTKSWVCGVSRRTSHRFLTVADTRAHQPHKSGVRYVGGMSVYAGPRVAKF